MRKPPAFLAPVSKFLASRKGIIIVGAAIGVIAALLQRLGNPPNMGICTACFVRRTWFART